MKRKRFNRNYFDLFEDYFNFNNNNLFNVEKYDYFDFDEFTAENDGTTQITTGEDEKGTWERREWTSSDGMSKMTSYVSTSKNLPKKIDVENLKLQLKSAVEKEDYLLADKLKKEIDSVK